MAKRVDMTFPFKGLNTSASPLRQPRGTCRAMKNALPRDWRANGLRRGAQRPGLSKFVADRPNGSNPFQAIAALEVVQATGESVLGSSVVTDSFVRSNTSAGDLGDLDGSSYDYNMGSNVVGVSSTIDTNGGTAQIENFSWSAVYASGSAAKILSNKCVDAQSADTSSGSAQASVCYFIPDSTTEPTDNYSAKLKFTTASSFASKESVVGLVCHGLNTTVAGGNKDGAFWIALNIVNNSGVAVINYGFNSTGASSGSYTYDDGSGYTTTITGSDPAKPAYVNSRTYLYPGSSGSDDNARALNTNTQYEIEIRVSGKRVEFLMDGASWLIFPDIAVGSNGTATPVTISRTQYGFVFYNVGAGSRASVASIDSFQVLNMTVGEPTATTRVVTVNGGDVGHGSRANDFEIANSGTDVFASTASVFALPGLGASSTSGLNYVYLLNGSGYRKVLVGATSAAVSTWSAAGGLGSLPTGSSDTTRAARYGVVWRNRIVLFGVDVNPDNWYMSRVGNPDDWSYTSSTDPARRAVAGNTSDTGLLPVAITCMAPFEADRMLVAGENRLWAMVGDPMLGGQFFAVSDRIGIVGPRAYTRDPSGNLYFCYADGVYVVPRGTLVPRPLSAGRIDRFFDAVDYTKVRVEMAWSRYMDSLLAFFIPLDGSAGTHLVWDSAEDSWSELTLEDVCGPTAICVYNDKTSMNDRGGDVTLLGGSDGYIRQFDTDADTDDGAQIDSRVDFAPLVADGVLMPSLDVLEPVFGANSAACKLQVVRALTAEALESTAGAVTRVFEGGGRRSPWLCRSTAHAVGVRLKGHDKRYWSLDGMSAEVGGTGRSGVVRG